MVFRHALSNLELARSRRPAQALWDRDLLHANFRFSSPPDMTSDVESDHYVLRPTMTLFSLSRMLHNQSKLRGMTVA